MTLTLTVFSSMVLKCNEQHKTTFSAYNRTHLTVKCRVITSEHLLDEVYLNSLTLAPISLVVIGPFAKGYDTLWLVKSALYHSTVEWQLIKT